VSRSLRRRLRRQDFVLRSDSDFDAVIDGCATREEGTWILPEMRAAYLHLHALGLAHSIEVWEDGYLAGGLYGVQVGGLFAAESMFHRTTDASKVALVSAVHALFAAGFRLFDVQFMTAHLATLGATEIPRNDYLARVIEAQSVRVRWDEVASSLEEPGFVHKLCPE
jgi:leucyl/phenylalanyl-tRNA--protein transferase